MLMCSTANGLLCSLICYAIMQMMIEIGQNRNYVTNFYMHYIFIYVLYAFNNITCIIHHPPHRNATFLSAMSCLTHIDSRNFRLL